MPAHDPSIEDLKTRQAVLENEMQHVRNSVDRNSESVRMVMKELEKLRDALGPTIRFSENCTAGRRAIIWLLAAVGGTATFLVAVFKLYRDNAP